MYVVLFIYLYPFSLESNLLLFIILILVILFDYFILINGDEGKI